MVYQEKEMKKLAYFMTILSICCLAGMLWFYNSSASVSVHVNNQRSFDAIEAGSAEAAAPVESQPAAESEVSEAPEVESVAESIAEPVEEETVSVGEADFTPERLIFIGDARTIAMYDAAAPDTEYDIRFVSTSGADLNWLNRSAFDTEYPYINSRTAVIVMLGISDMHRAEDYIRVLNEWGEVFPRDFGAHFYYDSVNPVDPGVFTNEQIEAFNSTVSAGLSENVTYIDTYSVLMQDGYETTDTLHYTDETTKHLYELFKQYFHWE